MNDPRVPKNIQCRTQRHYSAFLKSSQWQKERRHRRLGRHQNIPTMFFEPLATWKMCSKFVWILLQFRLYFEALSTTSRISKLKGPAKLQSYAGTRQGSCFSEYKSAIIEMCNFCKWKSFKINHRHWLHMNTYDENMTIWWYDNMMTLWHGLLQCFGTFWDVLTRFCWQIVTTGGPVIAPYTPAPGGPAPRPPPFVPGGNLGGHGWIKRWIKTARIAY